MPALAQRHAGWVKCSIAACLLVGSLAPKLAPAASAADTVRAASLLADSMAASHDSSSVDSTGLDSTSLQRAAESLTASAVSAPPETLVTPPPSSVPVFLGAKEVFRVRAARDGLDPKERAAAIRTRLTTAVLDDRTPADSVRLVSSLEGIEVRLGRHFLWVITSGDVEGMSPSELAASIAEMPEQIRAGIEKERAGRRPLGILIAFLLAAGLTLVAWLLARLVLTGGRKWRTWLENVLPKRLGAIRLRNFEVLSHTQVTGIVTAVLGQLHLVLGVLLLYTYLAVLFSLFPWTQSWSWQLLHFASTQATAALLSVASALPGLLMVVVIIVVFRWLIQLSNRFFDSVEAGTIHMGGLHPELARPSKRLLNIVLWLAAIIIAYPYIPGAQSKAFQGVSLMLGVLVSLGSTGIVGNMISGIVLTYSRSFKVGDRVQIGEHVGDVTSLGFFATKLRTIRNEEVTLPNGQVASSAVMNYTRLAADRGLILHTQVTIGYDVEWQVVHRLLIEAASKVEGVEREPAPVVYQRGLGDYNVAYELTCVTRQSHPQLKLYSDLHQEIQDAFARAGVEILSPAFHALRDANAAVLPAKPEGPRPPDGGFRVMRP